MNIIYQLWYNGKFHRYAQLCGNAHQRRVGLRKLIGKYEIRKYNVDTHESSLYRHQL